MVQFAPFYTLLLWRNVDTQSNGNMRCMFPRREKQPASTYRRSDHRIHSEYLDKRIECVKVDCKGVVETVAINVISSTVFPLCNSRCRGGSRLSSDS